MTYIIQREGPGLTPERLDELEAARPKVLRQEAPGVYAWLEEAPLTAEQHEKAHREHFNALKEWQSIAEKARRDRDEVTEAHALRQAEDATKQARYHLNELARLRKEGGK